MKNIFRKNQVIITALAIMIAVAGYLNFTQNSANEDSRQEAMSDGAILDVSQNTSDNSDLILDENNAAVSETENKTEGTEDTTDGNADAQTSDVEDITDESIAELPEQEIASESEEYNVADSGELAANSTGSLEENPGEAVLVNTTISASFFSSAKLTREQTRAKNKEMLMDLIENTNISENQKQDAIQSVINLTSIAEKENATELLLEAKGFEGAVVSIIDNTVDVVVNASNITNQQIAQIEDIVKRKTGVTSESIVITPVDASK